MRWNKPSHEIKVQLGTRSTKQLEDKSRYMQYRRGDWKVAAKHVSIQRLHSVCFHKSGNILRKHYPEKAKPAEYSLWDHLQDSQTSLTKMETSVLWAIKKKKNQIFFSCVQDYRTMIVTAAPKLRMASSNLFAFMLVFPRRTKRGATGLLRVARSRTSMA